MIFRIILKKLEKKNWKLVNLLTEIYQVAHSK